MYVIDQPHRTSVRGRDPGSGRGVTIWLVDVKSNDPNPKIKNKLKQCFDDEQTIWISV